MEGRHVGKVALGLSIPSAGAGGAFRKPQGTNRPLQVLPEPNDEVNRASRLPVFDGSIDGRWRRSSAVLLRYEQDDDDLRAGEEVSRKLDIIGLRRISRVRWPHCLFKVPGERARGVARPRLKDRVHFRRLACYGEHDAQRS